jgi:hypothetical protein
LAALARWRCHEPQASNATSAQAHHGNAGFAGIAGNAGNAGFAGIAGNAGNAGNAGFAGNAGNARHAGIAGFAARLEVVQYRVDVARKRRVLIQRPAALQPHDVAVNPERAQILPQVRFYSGLIDAARIITGRLVVFECDHLIPQIRSRCKWP